MFRKQNESEDPFDSALAPPSSPVTPTNPGTTLRVQPPPYSDHLSSWLCAHGVEPWNVEREFLRANETVQPGDVTQRVGVEVIRACGVDVEKLIKMLVANAAAEFASTYYYYTILRMNLAGHEDY